jgi:Ni2+-binding GTPase involved in maturation of urease and hydrogenase
MWTVGVGTSAGSIGDDDASAFSAVTMSAFSILFSGAVGGGKTIVMARFNASGAVGCGKTRVAVR